MSQPINPYIAGAPLRGERGFFGRQDTLDWVARELRNLTTNVLVIFGQRRIGKTSLLLQLQRILPADIFLPIYFDLQIKAIHPLGQVLADLAEEVAKRTELESPDADAFDDQGRFFHREFLPQLYQVLGKGRRPVFLLDEFDVLDQVAEAELLETAAAKALFPFLRRVMTEDSQPAFVFVVGRRAEDLTLDFTSTFKASLVREIWVLDRESAEALVRQAESNGTLRFTNPAVMRILNLTNHHPYLTQLLCQRIWEQAYAGNPPAPPRIDVPEVEAAVSNALEAGNQALTWLWNGLSTAERIYAATLADATDEREIISEDQVIRVLTAHAVRLRTREVELAPLDLVKRRVLEEVEEREYRFAVELFRRWVHQYKPLRDVKDELDQVDPLAVQIFSIGQGFFHRRLWEPAIPYFQDVLKANPRHFGAQLHLGEALLELGRTDEAVIELEQAYSLDQDEAKFALVRALLAQAKAREKAGDEQGALDACERALEISPDEPSAQALRVTIVRAYREVGTVPRRQYMQHLAGVLIAAFLVLLVGGWAANTFYFQPREAILQAEITVQAVALATAEQQIAQVHTAMADAHTLTPTPTLRPTQTLTPTPTPILTPALPVLVGTQVPRPVATISPANADQVTQLARWGKGIVSEIAYSADGTLLAVASSVGIYLYNTQMLTDVLFIETGAWVNSVAFSPDGAMLASGLEDDTVRLWQVDDGALLHTLEGHTAPVNSVVFSPDGTMLASGSEDNRVQLWRVDYYRALRRILEGHTALVNSVVFSPDGTMLASGSEDNTVRLWQVDDGALLHTLEGHTWPVNSVAFAPDGAMLASGSDDHTVRLWQVDDGALLHTLEGHTAPVNSVAFSPDGVTLASGSEDDTVRQWWVDIGAPLRTLERHKGNVSSVAFSPDKATLASGSGDGTVRLWGVGNGTLLHTLQDVGGKVNSVAFSPDKATLASGSGDGTVRLWRVDHGLLLHALEGHRWSVKSIGFSPDGAMLASGSWQEVRLWRVDDGALLHTVKGHTDWVESVAFSPDGTTLASGSYDNTVRLWRVDDGTPLHTLEGHQEFVTSVTFSPDGTTLASASDDHTVRLWRVSDGALLRSLKGHPSKVRSVAFSPDGETLSSGADDRTVRLWRVDDGTLLYTLEGHVNPVYDVAFSPDGAMLASGSWQEVRLWRVDDGALLHAMGEHRGWVESVVFAPDGAMLASGSLDGTVRLWGVVGK